MILIIAILLMGAALLAYFLTHRSETQHSQAEINQTLRLRPLEYKDALRYRDSSEIERAILSGDYDTSIHESRSFVLKKKDLILPSLDFSDPIIGIKSSRDYLYKLIAVPATKAQIIDSLDHAGFDSITDRLITMKYAGNCDEHSHIVRRLLQDRYTTVIYTLKRDSGQLIDHVLDLAYYRDHGRTYAVTIDALMGIVGPVKQDGSFYTVEELSSIDPLLDYPAVRKAKRYIVDTAFTFSNVYNKMATEYYTDNGLIYYEGYDDMYILAHRELLYDKMPRKEFDEKYARVLARILRANVPKAVIEFRSED